MNPENQIIIYLIIAVVIGIACGFACEKIAKSKGYPAGSWWLIGFFFGVLALIAVVIIPVKKTKNNQNGVPQMNTPNQSFAPNAMQGQGFASNNSAYNQSFAPNAMQDQGYRAATNTMNIPNQSFGANNAPAANNGNWDCPICMTKNTGADKRCKKCGRLRP